jgi:zinc protease
LDFFPKSSPKHRPKLPFKARSSEGLDIVLIDKPELTQTQFFIGHSSITSTHEDLIALDMFATAFAGSMFQAKYMQEIRVKRGWSYGAYGSIDARRDAGAFYLVHIS